MLLLSELMMNGEMSAAASIASRIGQLIVAHNSKIFESDGNHLDKVSNIKDLWARVRQITKICSEEPNIAAISAEQLNIHYANISTDPQYEPPLLKSTVSDNKIIFEEITTFNLLDRIKPTSEGPDRIPLWFLRLTAASIARPLTYLINLAFLNSVVPTQWKTSIISLIGQTFHSQKLALITGRFQLRLFYLDCSKNRLRECSCTQFSPYQMFSASFRINLHSGQLVPQLHL